MFYEMLSGRRASPGNSTASILGATLHLDADPLDAPPSLSAIVSRCLSRAPVDRYQSAQELLQALQQADPYAMSGDSAQAKKVLEHLQKLSTERYIGPYNSAVIYAGLGEKDKAFELLNGAYEARSYLLVEYLNTDPRLDSLQGDPRFGALRNRIGLPTPPT
jgi:serine/threonine protein kinase